MPQTASVLCTLVDTPGLSFPEPKSTTIDASFWLAPLAEDGSGEYVGASTLAMAGALSSEVTSTLSIECAPLPGPTSPASIGVGWAALTAVQTSHNL